MPINPSKERDFRHLKRALESDQKLFKPFVDLRNKALTKMVGRNYSDNGDPLHRPVNFIALATRILTRQLVASRPRSLVTTFDRSKKAAAFNTGLALNVITKKIKLGQTLKSVALDAVFSMGIVKIGVHDGDDSLPGDYRFSAGYPFVKRVDIEDWCHDMQARSLEEASYMSNRYRRELEEVQESDLYDFDAKQLQPDEKQPGSGDEASDLSGKKTDSTDNFKQYVSLRDVWIPGDKRLVTIVDNQSAIDKPIRDLDLRGNGPPNGPFHVLGFGEVPNNVMPLPPRALWEDLDGLGNLLFRKLANQAANAKKVVGVKGKADADGMRVLKSSDGDMIRLDDPKAVQEMALGGIDPQNLAFFLQIRDLFSYFAGNIDSLGGLGPQTETLGQDELLSKAASMQIQDSQEAVIDFTTEIMEDLGWYLWNDPEVQIPIIKTLKGVPDFHVSLVYDERQKEGLFSDYTFEIQPYSMQYQPPKAKLSAIMNILTQLIMPLAPQLAQEGKQIDFDSLFRIIAEYADLPELEEIITFSSSNQFEEAAQEARATKSPVSTRNYVRTNRSGMTRSGKDFATIQSLMGVKTQPAVGVGMNSVVG